MGDDTLTLSEEARYERWIEAIVRNVRDGRAQDIIEHIQKHALEVTDAAYLRNRSYASWSASMHNLLDIFDGVYGIEVTIAAKISKLANHHRNYPATTTAEPL